MGKASQKREIRRAFGPEIETALAELRGQVVAVGGGQRMLAGEMQRLERDVAAARTGRAHDSRTQGARLDELKEQLEALLMPVNLQIVGGEQDRALSLRAAIPVLVDALMRQHERRVELDDRVYAIECWIKRRQRLTRWQRLRSFVTGRCAAPFDANSTNRRPMPQQAEQAAAWPAAVIHNPTPAQLEEFAEGIPAWSAPRVDARLGSVGGE